MSPPPVFRPSPQELTAEQETVRDKLRYNRLDQHDTPAKLQAKEKVLSNLVSVSPCTDHQDPRPDQAHSGKCSWCDNVHKIERTEAAVTAVRALHADLMRENESRNRDAATAQGKMIGVLVCVDEKRNVRELKAFSGPTHAIVNVRGDWCCDNKPAPRVQNFNGALRDFNNADEVDNPPGNCAAQKLLHYAAEYNENEAGRRIKGLQDQINEIERKRKDLFQDARDMEPSVLLKWLRALPETEMQALGLTTKRRDNILNQRPDLASNIRIEAVKLDPEVVQLNTDQARLENEIEAIGRNPPKLIPVGLAEAWIGDSKGGFPPKRNGEIIDSCYTCHNTIGDVLCGLEELQKAYKV